MGTQCRPLFQQAGDFYLDCSCYHGSYPNLCRGGCEVAHTNNGACGIISMTVETDLPRDASFAEHMAFLVLVDNLPAGLGGEHKVRVDCNSVLSAWDSGVLAEEGKHRTAGDVFFRLEHQSALLTRKQNYEESQPPNDGRSSSPPELLTFVCVQRSV